MVHFIFAPALVIRNRPQFETRLVLLLDHSSWDVVCRDIEEYCVDRRVTQLEWTKKEGSKESEENQKER
jgi:hypothetical protein